MQKRYKSKSSTGAKVYAVIVSLLLVAAIVLTGCAFGLNWIQVTPTEEVVDIAVDDDNGGMVVDESETSGVSLTMTKISEEEYAEYGISPLAETAYTITVTPDPSDATDTYDWTCTNTSQISLSPSSNTKSCTVTCSGAFATQAVITVSSTTTPDVYAEVTVDYVSRLSSVTYTISGGSISFGSTSTSHTITATPVWGTGTITPTFTITGGTLSNNNSVTYTSSNTVTNSDGSQTIYTRTLTLTDYSFSGDSFSISTPASAFVSGSTTSYQDRVSMSSTVEPLAMQTTYPTESAVISLFNNSFMSNATGTTSDGTLIINYTISYTPSGSYAGSYSTSGSSSVGVAFDVSGLAVTATDIDVNYDGIIF